MSAHYEINVQNESGQKTLSSYVTGLILSLALTLMAFGLMEKRMLSDNHLYLALAVLAITQLFVQAMCFLRLNASAEGRWSLMPFIFSILIMAIFISGSLWIMFNCNYYMMH